jgi:uncharacterized membrane protein
MADGAAARGRLSVIGLALVPVLFHLVIVATSGTRLAIVPRVGVLFKLGFVTASALTHWSIYTILLVTFASTLRPGHDPLISAMARRMHEMTAELMRYTRRVTIAWTVFFALQLATSILLFWFAPLVVWSFFVNILDIPLVALMFASEYAVRLRCLRDPPRHSLAAIMRMVADIRKPVIEPARL